MRVVVALAWVLALAAGCGAKTGLRIPEYRLDAGRLDVGMDAGSDVGTDVGVDAPMCMPGHFVLTPETAELMLVIDRSASMRLDIAGNPDQPVDLWRWTILHRALADALGTLDPRVLVGAKFFPDPIVGPNPTTAEACSGTGPVDVLPGPDTRAAILSLFDSTDPNGGTPTAVALQIAADGFSATATRRFMVLATDGAPNCNAGLDGSTCVCTSPMNACRMPTPGVFSCLNDVRTIQVLERLVSDQNIPTYVVGIEGPDFVDTLDAMAVAGGRPRMGDRAFYSVRSADQLQQALMEITGSISACGFVTPSLPPEDNQFSLRVDGVVVPQDPVNGWAWVDRPRGELELHGTACDLARGSSRVEAIIDTCIR